MAGMLNKMTVSGFYGLFIEFGELSEIIDAL